MGGKVLNGSRIYIGFPIPAWKAKANDWSNVKVTGWVKNAGGTVQQQFNELTATHLVVDEKQWQNKTRTVQTALETNENGGKIHIVSPDWLENCIEEQRKCREGTYLWEKLDQVASSSKQKKRGKSGGDEVAGEDAGERRRAPQALLGEVFQESTEPFVEERDLRAYEAELAGELKARKEREEAETRIREMEKLEAEKKRRERAEMMRKTVKRGRGEVFNENYHAWQDDTGFAYDIMLTKVDTLTNSNERINLTIFESNALPHTYATNLHFAGTGKRPMNNILATIGSNLNTSMRFFRQAFQEKTGCNWDDRIKVSNERVRARASESNGGLKSVTRAAEDAVPFEKRVFEYLPPAKSSRGLLPDGKDEVPEVVKQMRAIPAQIDLTDDDPAGEPVISSAEMSDFHEILDVSQLLTDVGENHEEFDVTTLLVQPHEFDFGLSPDGGTQVNQTQLATVVGEELLDLDNDRAVATDQTSKRDDDMEEETSVAKKAATEPSG